MADKMIGDMGGMASDAIQVPVSALGGAKVGQTVELKVDSIDEESGMATLSPSGMEVESPEPKETPEAEQSAIQGASELFNE